VVYALFIWTRLAANGYDLSAFVWAGDVYVNPALVPPSLHVQRDYIGYDGQFFYRLALDPFTSRAADFGITLDLPAYRQQRIVYPLIVWALSLGGRPALVPSLMIAVNFAALCAIGWLAGSYARSLRRNALWGILVALYPGFFWSLSLDLSEILECCLILSGLLLLQRGKHLAAALALTLAVLTKEPALLVVVGVVIAGVLLEWRTETRRHGWRVLLIPVVVYLLGQLFLFHVWGQVPVLAGNHNLGLPLQGLSGAVVQFLTEKIGTYVSQVVLVLAFSIAVAFSLGATRAVQGVRLSWVLYGSLAVLLTGDVWNYDVSFLRALSEWYVLGALIVIGSKERPRRTMLAGMVAIWLVIVLRHITTTYFGPLYHP